MATKRRRRVGSFLILTLILGLPLVLHAQDSTNAAVLQHFDKQIVRYSADVQTWQVRADMAFYLGLGIMILGLLCGAGSARAQSPPKPAVGAKPSLWKSGTNWVRAGVVVAGLLVTVVSAVKEYKFAGDPKELKKLATQGREIVLDLGDIRDRFKVSAEPVELDELQKSFASNESKFIGIRDKLYASWSWGGGQVVYAVASQPAWITRLPNDPRALQAVGKAEAPTLTDAKAASSDDAVRQLAVQLVPKAGPNQVIQSTQAGAANDLIASQAEVVNTYFEHDVAKKVYRFYTWLRINKEATSLLYLPRARVQHSVTIPLPASGASKVAVPLAAANPSEGSFVFTFLVTRQGTGVSLELLQIETIQDGSVGSTRWYFDASVNGTLRMSLPEGRYDDSPSKRVTKPGQTVRIPSVNGPSLSLSLTGYKPKDFVSKE